MALCSAIYAMTTHSTKSARRPQRCKQAPKFNSAYTIITESFIVIAAVIEEDGNAAEAWQKEFL